MAEPWDISLLVRHQRRIFSVRPPKLSNEMGLLDLRRLSGKRAIVCFQENTCQKWDMRILYSDICQIDFERTSLLNGAI